MLNDYFITRLLLSLTVKEFWKSVNIWQSYGRPVFFDSWVVGILSLLMDKYVDKRLLCRRTLRSWVWKCITALHCCWWMLTRRISVQNRSNISLLMDIHRHVSWVQFYFTGVVTVSFICGKNIYFFLQLTGRYSCVIRLQCLCLHYVRGKAWPESRPLLTHMWIRL